MRKPLLLMFLIFGALCIAAPSMAQSGDAVPAHPFISTLFTDNMVLQRDRKDPIWGWATAGTKVTATLDGSTSTAVATGDGKWTPWYQIAPLIPYGISGAIMPL